MLAMGTNLTFLVSTDLCPSLRVHSHHIARSTVGSALRVTPAAWARVSTARTCAAKRLSLIHI